MLDEYGFETYEENPFPLAYLLTFRTFGTWLHGDERKSVGRNGDNIYGMPRIPPKPNLQKAMKKDVERETILSESQRKVIEEAIAEVCRHRGYLLHAVNARTNHIHAVVSAQMKPERIIDAFKSYATRRLRKNGLVPRSQKVWSRGRSREYLWKPRSVERAVDYVLNRQDGERFEID